MLNVIIIDCLSLILIDLPDALKHIVCKFRTVNHKLTIETGRYTRISRNESVCKMCNSGQLGDEFHFCLECPALKELRNKFLLAIIYKKPNVINFGPILKAAPWDDINFRFSLVMK